MRTLLNSREAFDAGLLGYDGPCDPSADSDGLIVKLDEDRDGPIITITGPDGEIVLFGETMARVLGETLIGALKIHAQTSAFKRRAA